MGFRCIITPRRLAVDVISYSGKWRGEGWLGAIATRVAGPDLWARVIMHSIVRKRGRGATRRLWDHYGRTKDRFAGMAGVGGQFLSGEDPWRPGQFRRA